MTTSHALATLVDDPEPSQAVVVATPHYVLMQGSHRLGPPVAWAPDDRACEAIYGFSDRATYDAFQRRCATALTPYPLVKTYLRSQIDEAGDRLLLVIVDAPGPDAPDLQAATMQAVLAAHEQGAATVAASIALHGDSPADFYTLTAAST